LLGGALLVASKAAQLAGAGGDGSEREQADDAGADPDPEGAQSKPLETTVVTSSRCSPRALSRVSVAKPLGRLYFATGLEPMYRSIHGSGGPYLAMRAELTVSVWKPRGRL
jgi:hypothetical protein